MLAGTTWQVIVNLAQANGAKIDAVKPVEGATGWSDTWMLSSKAANPNCMKLWMDWIASPWANAQVAVWFGEAPSNAKSCELDGMAEHCDHVPRRRRRLLEGRVVLDHRHRGVPRRAHRREVRAVHRMGERLEQRSAPDGDRPDGREGFRALPSRSGASTARSTAGAAWASASTLGAAAGVDAASSTSGRCVLLVVSAFYALDPVTQKPTDEFTWDNLVAAFNIFDPAVRDTVWVLVRTVGVALLVTVLCFLIALPVAFFVAKVAWRWMRRGIIVAMLMPLWAGYLVKGYAWRAMVAPSGGKFAASGKGAGGFLEATFGWTPGYGRVAIVITLVYFWLPYMVLPIYAGLDRMPPSLLDAAGDLGARPFRTFRSVILPLLLPGHRRRLASSPSRCRSATTSSRRW